ncbi:MAG TPA: hypothetical protein VFQ53_21025 [Kofleriaceae bacterium]|nr:hypothetical protein [Kofleriaceae bacterium]
MKAFFHDRRGWFIAIFVAVQLVLPLRYYLAHRDPHDERFAWRMFSPMRMATCTPAFEIDHKPVALGNEFHEAWIELARRGRFAVVEAMARRLCSDHPGAEVTVKLSCKYIDRAPVDYGGFDMCQLPEL